ncbi:efflux RND transporter periplasmic adaptor subunit [Sulfurovum sp.]|uniref:efflux RND transporter periplasmic adaptor subunit n=1 Tax=Sulfurovum sp. TaxID=1969726 RepID=UPI0025D29B0D|nr:biotin/lipoyl-binding protein [Sulfurovum sp.]
MKRFYTLLFLAILGIVIGAVTIFYGNKPIQVKIKPILSIKPPFSSYVAGTGMIEASSTNISVGTPISGVLTELFVKVGDNIKVGDILFKIDDRDMRSLLQSVHAKVKVAEAALQKSTHQFEIAQNLNARDPGAVSKADFLNRKDDVEQAKAVLALAKAEVVQYEMDLERYTVRALMPGRVLQCKMRVGTYVQASSVTPALLILGSNTMNLRVDVNEYDAWRIKPHTSAVAFVRGHPELKIALDYAYMEPYIVSKTALSGQSTERTDTRVLQIVYHFKESDFPVYVGQQLDVFIQTNENNTTRAEL